MSLEAQATYENGVLKLDKPLPLGEHERVTVSHHTASRSHPPKCGIDPVEGGSKALEYMLGPDNQLWVGP